jgi:hypothetical protein
MQAQSCEILLYISSIKRRTYIQHRKHYYLAMQRTASSNSSSSGNSSIPLPPSSLTTQPRLPRIHPGFPPSLPPLLPFSPPSTGDFLFLAGLVFIIGLQRTVRLFTKRDRAPGIICFFLGILLVFVR